MFLATGERVRRLVSERGEAETLEDCSDTLRALVLGKFEAAQRKINVITHVGHDDLVLRIGEDEANLAANVFAMLGHVYGIHEDFP